MYMNYLKITLHDNDFYNLFHQLGNCLQNSLVGEDEDNIIKAEKIDFEKFRATIIELMLGLYYIDSRYWIKGIIREDSVEDIRDYFERKLKITIVDKSEIESDNDEVLYVPLCTYEDLNQGISYFVI